MSDDGGAGHRELVRVGGVNQHGEISTASRFARAANFGGFVAAVRGGRPAAPGRVAARIDSGEGAEMDFFERRIVREATTNEIRGDAKNVRALLQGVKYVIDYYQREYKWGKKQVVELVEDLTSSFLNDYSEEHPRSRVESYRRYFLGSIIISKKDGKNYIVDGQQRLTTLTLLLIFLRSKQKGPSVVAIEDLIYSEKYGQKSFNLEVEERKEALKALFEGRDPTTDDESQSVQNLIARYQDITEAFPDEIDEHALPYFVDWLKENVYLVEISTYSDEDAYTIFETMNDRGLSLSPTDMLKGYLLANIEDSVQRNEAHNVWNKCMEKLRAFEQESELRQEVQSDFFKAWFRSQYAEKIRERRAGAKAWEDFDRNENRFIRT